MKFLNLKILLIIFLIAVRCKGTDKIASEIPVSNNNKTITVQDKRILELTDLGVYASNEFVGARLNGLEKVNDSTAVVIINPENEPINKSPYYAFKVWSNSPRAFYFKFQYPKGFKHRYIPKLRKEQTWRTMDSTDIFKNDSIVTVKLNLDKTPLTVAAQEINTSADVNVWVDSLIKGKESYVKHSIYGKSVLGRNLAVLDICKKNRKGKDVIVLLTRQHPPEVTGYFAYQSFLSTLLNDSNLSNTFLEKYRILAFPLLNPDGVDLGHWRHNVGGVDLNRDWFDNKQPEVEQTISYILKQLEKYKSKVILGLDFHSTYKDVFYTNKTREGTTLPNFIEDWFSALESNISDYKVNEAAGNSTNQVSKGWFLYKHKAVGITYEIGDDTPRDRIQTIGSVSAEQMMHVLLKTD